MIENINDILGDVQLLKLIHQSRQKLKVEFEESIYLRYNQGLFRADKETLLFNELLAKNPSDRYIVIDVNDIPIEIIDLQDFNEKLLEIYHKATNNYLQSYNRLKTLRTKEAFFQ